MADLHDTREDYLETIVELEEEGIPPLRARVAERLGLAVPTVSETVARLEDDGLLVVGEDRVIQLTPVGRKLAISVVRRHRLAERLLTDVIGIEWSKVHHEASKWEHAISEHVEQKIVELLGDPGCCPHGNPIPGSANRPDHSRAVTVVACPSGPVDVARITEDLETDDEALVLLEDSGFVPGRAGKVLGPDGDGVRVAGTESEAVLPPHVAAQTYVIPV